MTTTRREFCQRAVAATSALLVPGMGEPVADHASNPGDCPDFYCDDDGLIVHRGSGPNHRDGGDTAQREGWYWFGVWIREKKLKSPWNSPRKLTFPDVIKLLEPNSDGVFYRHPKLPPWNNPYDKEWGFSRDQMIPLIAAMGVWGLHAPLLRLWNALPQDKLGGTKHTFNGEWVPSKQSPLVHTGDPILPATINLYRRGLNQDPMAAGDGNGPGGEQDLAINVGLRITAALNDRDNTGDDLNLVVSLIMSTLVYPSTTSTQAANLYAKNRPVSYGSFLGTYYQKYGFQQDVLIGLMKSRIDQGIASGWQTDSSRVYGAIRWYQRAEAGANPALAELYRPIIKAYLE